MSVEDQEDGVPERRRGKRVCRGNVKEGREVSTDNLKGLLLERM